MARVTVEDCVVKIPNRFELVLLAAQRAREITSGAPLTLERDDDKNPVVALREIADETIGLLQLKDLVVRGMQKHAEIDEPEEPHDLDIDPMAFGVAAPVALLDEGDEAGAGISADEVDLDAEDELTLDEELAADALGEAEDDVLAVEEEDLLAGDEEQAEAAEEAESSLTDPAADLEEEV